MGTNTNINAYSEPHQVEQNSLETIALTFSGGGFRATAFGLGVLEYLHRLDLLKKVVYMASASGGSILTMKYALCQAQADGENYFQDFKEDMLKIMHECDLLNNSLKTLRERNVFYKDNKPNLINSFAYQYNKELYYDNTIADLKSKSGHLQELCINCSDLSTGLPFRGIIFFDPNKYIVKDSKFGNSIVYLRERLINQIKLADLVAASSCFPLGFEPMILTKDFAYGDEFTSLYIKGNVKLDERLTTYQEYKELFDNREIALLDGGITDNTAIDSLIKSDEERENVKKNNKKEEIKMYDFIMINDVGSFNIPPSDFKTKKVSLLGFLNVRNYISIIFTSLFVLLFSVVKPLSYLAHKSFGYMMHLIEKTIIGKFLVQLYDWNILIYFFIILIYCFFNFVVLRSSLILRIVFHYLPRFNLNYYSLGLFTDFLLTTKIKYYNNMFSDRIQVAKSLLQDAFLNRIKKLNLEAINKNPRYNKRKKCNNIIDLSSSMLIYNSEKRAQYKFTDEEIKLLSHNTELLHSISDEVSKMPTTLWFEGEYYKKNYLEKIIAAGHYTTCHNLLEYFIKNKELQTKYESIYKLLVEDFENFKSNPYLISK